MLRSEFVEIGLGSKNIKYYESLGYEIPRRKNKWNKVCVPRGTKIEVKIIDLPEKSNDRIELICDYCGEDFDRRYADHTFIKSKEVINKDACDDCAELKFRESYMIQNGVENPFMLGSVKEKIKETNNEKYGVDNPMFLDKFKNKVQQTCMNKYGVDNASKSEEIKQKIVDTINNRFGVNNIMDLEEYRLKIAETLSKNQSVATSKQQKYLHKIIGGKLNYTNQTPVLDIAFPEEKIYLEYNGGGHNLGVKLGSITQKEFKKKELKRYHYLKDKGWKAIFINSSTDLLPSDNKLQEIFKIGKEYLLSDSRWIKFDLDSNLIIYDKYKICFDYGKLRKIKESDLEEVG